MTSINAFVNRYVQQAQTATPADAANPSPIKNQAASPASPVTESFHDVVTHLMDSTKTATQKGEQAALNAALGRADITDVVLAADEAKISLTAFKAVLNAGISAYKEISSMQL